MNIEHHMRMLIADINKLKTLYDEMGMGDSPYDPPELQQVLYQGKWIYKVELKAAIASHEARLETLRKIKNGQPISNIAFRALLEMDVFAKDEGIRDYLFVVPQVGEVKMQGD